MPGQVLQGNSLKKAISGISNQSHLDVVELIILVALESVVHMAHCLARLVPECDQGVLYISKLTH